MNHNRPEHPSVDVAVETLAQRWLQLDTRTRELHRALADQPGGDPSLWSELEDARSERDRVAQQLGTALGRWLAQGGDLDLLEPEPEAAPVPAPSPREPAPKAAPEPRAPEAPKASTAPAAPARPPAAAPKPVSRPASPSRPATPPPAGARPPAKPQPPSPQSRDHLQRLTDRLVDPLKDAHLTALRAWIDTADRLWPERLPSLSSIHDVMQALVFRLRALQERSDTKEVAQLIQAVHRFYKERDRRYVHGLAWNHQPRLGSWDEDARDALGLPPPRRARPPRPTAEEALRILKETPLDELEARTLRERVVGLLGTTQLQAHDKRLARYLADRYEDLKGEGKLQPVRKAIKKLRKDQAPAAARPEQWPADDWPYLPLTRGRRAVIIGGNPVPRRRDEIREAFHLQHVEWKELSANYLAQLQERAKNGTLDLLIFIRFGGHICDDLVLIDEVRKDRTRWVRAESGYGILEIRESMEAQWADCLPPESPGEG